TTLTVSSILTTADICLSKGLPDWSGNDIISVNITDLGNIGAGGPLSTVGEVTINVSPVNDPPYIYLDLDGHGLLPGGGVLGLEEDSSLPLALLSVTDKEVAADGVGRLTLSLWCVSGAAEVVWAIGGLAKGAGVGPWPAVAFSGELAEVNRALHELEYLPASDWHGIDDLTLEASDNDHQGAGDPQTSSFSIQVVVAPVNDAPVV
ncbi:unnamed protein product, partial [Sphacelaria rigidula]